jgi:hypothetical protein
LDFYAFKIRLKWKYYSKFYHLLKFTFPSLKKPSINTLSSDRLNSIRKILKKDEISYLEIGIENANTFVNVRAEKKIGVDPFPLRRPPLHDNGMFIRATTSEKFFKENSTLFDLVFIDGLHTYEQTYEDVLNSFSSGSEQCLVLVDDVIPSDTYAALRSQLECQILKHKNGIPNNYWMGDVFKLLPLLTNFHKEFCWSTIFEENENPQLLLWRSPEMRHIVPRSMIKEFQEIEGNYSFTDIFQYGVPEYFRIKTFD